MTIHDHFEGSANCVECGGPCSLKGDERAVSDLIRFTLQTLSAHEMGVNPFIRSALRSLGVDPVRMYGRADESNRKPRT